jgi:hypothetical protein
VKNLAKEMHEAGKDVAMQICRHGASLLAIDETSI